MSYLLLASQDVVTTLRDLNDLSLLNQLTDSSTSTRSVDLQTIHNGVDGDQLHLHHQNHLSTQYLRHLVKELVIISLLKVHLVINSFSHLSLAPLLKLSK